MIGFMNFGIIKMNMMHNWREARVRRDWGETLLRMQYAFGG